MAPVTRANTARIMTHAAVRLARISTAAALRLERVSTAPALHLEKMSTPVVKRLERISTAAAVRLEKIRVIFFLLISAIVQKGYNPGPFTLQKTAGSGQLLRHGFPPDFVE